MSDTARDYQTIEPATTEGLEDLFEVHAQPLRDGGETAARGLSFKEACAFYGLKPTALRTRIKTGEISAEKVDGPNGPEWRVFSERVAQQSRTPDATVTPPSHETDNRLLDIIQDLQSKLDTANRELQGASYRVGYLENQIIEREQDILAREGQIKLLTDSQHNPSRWAQFKKWFLGQ